MGPVRDDNLTLGSIRLQPGILLKVLCAVILAGHLFLNY